MPHPLPQTEFLSKAYVLGDFPDGPMVKNLPANAGDTGLTLGDSEGQGSLVYCSAWAHNESDLT